MSDTLHALCKASKLTQQAIADAIGVSHGTLYGYLSGQRPVPDRHIAALALVLEVPASRIPTRAPLKRGPKRDEAAFPERTPPEPVRADDPEPCWICTRAPCVCHARLRCPRCRRAVA